MTQTKPPPENPGRFNSWSELALAHVEQNKARAAYARKDLLEKRRKMMNAWADFVAGKRPAPAVSVTAR